jgi:prepilin-type processing-associated H-X9-DG protein
LLPYLEQEAVYHQLDFSQPVQNSTAIKTLLPVFLCPAEPIPPESFNITDQTLLQVAFAAPSSYAATVGSDASEADGVDGNGVFYRNSTTRLAEITDGLGCTVLAGDRAWSQAKGTWAGAPNGGRLRAGVLNPWPFATAAAPVLVLAHNNWLNILTDSDGGLDDFSSNHNGGANLLFADGSVHFVHSITRDGQDRYDFWALGTRDGNEVIQALEF